MVYEYYNNERSRRAESCAYPLCEAQTVLAGDGDSNRALRIAAAVTHSILSINTLVNLVSHHDAPLHTHLATKNVPEDLVERLQLGRARWPARRPQARGGSCEILP